MKPIKSSSGEIWNHKDMWGNVYPADGLTFVGCCGGNLYQKPISKSSKISVPGLTVCNRRVTGHNSDLVDKTIVKTSNGYLTIFAVKTHTGRNADV